MAKLVVLIQVPGGYKRGGVRIRKQGVAARSQTVQDDAAKSSQVISIFILFFFFGYFFHANCLHMSELHAGIRPLPKDTLLSGCNLCIIIYEKITDIKL